MRFVGAIVLEGKNQLPVRLPFGLDRHRVREEFELKCKPLLLGREPLIRAKLADKRLHIRSSFCDFVQLRFERSERIVRPLVHQVSNPRLRTGRGNTRARASFFQHFDERTDRNFDLEMLLYARTSGSAVTCS